VTTRAAATELRTLAFMVSLLEGGSFNRRVVVSLIARRG